MEGRLSEFQIGSDFAGFRIEGVLGRGGMGIVYLADDPELDRRIALKVIRAEFADDRVFRRRFASESRAAAAIEHPNVISVYRAGEHAGRPYLAMRYVPGRNLRARIGADGRMQPQGAARLVGQVAEALDSIHLAGLVHRDVKPANVIVSDRGGRLTAYLTDFGLAKAAMADAGLTTTGEVIGSLDYLAPEQIEGRRVDARTDVYALGCVFYELLTARVPFPARESSAKLWAHLNEPPPWLAGKPDAALAGLDGVVRRAMAKDPEDRFPSAGALGRAAIAAAAGVSASLPEREDGAADRAAATTEVPGSSPPTTRALPTEVAPTEPRPRPSRARRRVRRIGAAIAALALTAALAAGGLGVLEPGQDAGADPRTVEIPTVRGERLDLAEQALRGEGLRSRTVGGGLLGIVIAANWEVCDSEPDGGDEVRPGATVELLVDRPGAC